MSTAPHRPSASAPSHLVLKRGHLLAIGAVAVLPWCILLLLLARPTAIAPDLGSRPTVPVSSRPATAPSNVAPQIGVWGELELTRIVIEPPDELISINAETRTSVTWHFVGYSEDQLIDLLNNAALPVNLQARLLDHQSWERRADRLLLRVPKDLILALPMESRRVLYAALSPFAENGGQWAPASFRANSAADWFAGSGLTDRTVSLVQPLLYRRGAALLFSDLDLILADIKTQRQRMLLLRTLARSTAQLAKLRIRPDTDLSAVIDYWSVGQARRAIAPLLKSLPRDEDGFAIDLVHLLPPPPDGWSTPTTRPRLRAKNRSAIVIGPPSTSPTTNSTTAIATSPPCAPPTPPTTSRSPMNLASATSTFSSPREGPCSMLRSTSPGTSCSPKTVPGPQPRGCSCECPTWSTSIRRMNRWRFATCVVASRRTRSTPDSPGPRPSLG